MFLHGYQVVNSILISFFYCYQFYCIIISRPELIFKNFATSTNNSSQWITEAPYPVRSRKSILFMPVLPHIFQYNSIVFAPANCLCLPPNIESFNKFSASSCCLYFVVSTFEWNVLWLAPPITLMVQWRDLFDSTMTANCHSLQPIA